MTHVTAGEGGASSMVNSGEAHEQCDVVVLGAGVTGLHMLYKARKLGLSVRVLEAGSGVGGTWFWNRYPGARFDSESVSYGYSFEREALSEWRWSEHYAPQVETERYLNFVADKLDLRQHIRFNSRVSVAQFDGAANQWNVESEDGHVVHARFLITAIGGLSAAQMPENLTGLEDFRGRWFHTADWPSEPVDLSGLRVAVIGTGATGVQVITEVAKTAAHLTVFQRTANYALPLRNRLITEEEHAEFEKNLDEIFQKCAMSPAGFMYEFGTQLAADLSSDERHTIFEKLWELPGFAKWLAGFPDMMLHEHINTEYSEFVRGKIRERIDDPALAAKLVPTFPFGTRRTPMESGYWEVYNQDNVDVRFLPETPIERYTPAGIRVGGEDLEFDVIVFATGFDAFTGAFDRIEFKGVAGETLKDHWADGPRTFLGLAAHGFPNLFTLVGPHNKGSFCNIPRCSEQNVNWTRDCLNYLGRHGLTRIEATAEAEDAWLEHIEEGFSKLLLLHKYRTKSFWLGTNTPGKKETFYGYPGSFPEYREHCDDSARHGYRGFTLSAPAVDGSLAER